LIVYHVQQWDYILRYEKSSDETADNVAREAFEKKLCKAGLILEIEQSVEYDSEYYVKIMFPFHVLCEQAQKDKLRLELHVRIY
jgi:hypothetical protein